MKWYILFWQNYFNIGGRSCRAEFWIAAVVNWAIEILLPRTEVMIYGFPVLAILFALAGIIPNWTVTVRRLHDTGRSGWWILVGVAPILALLALLFVPLRITSGSIFLFTGIALLGCLALLVILALDSQPGPNRYGPNPKTGNDDQYNQNYQGYQD